MQRNPKSLLKKYRICTACAHGLEGVMNFFLLFAFLFFVGSCLGWCIELLFRRFISKNNPERVWINPGFLTGPYLPLYGFGLWGMYEVSHVIRMLIQGNPVIDLPVIFVIMAIVMTFTEYIAGLIFIKGMNMKLWDYSNEKLNLQGIICPKFSVIWGLLGTVYYFTLDKYVEDWVAWLSGHLAYSFFVGMFFGVFAVDLAVSLQLSMKIRKFAVDNDLVVRYEELKGTIRKRNEARREKIRFLLAFRSELPLKEHLQEYLEQSVRTGKERLARAREYVTNRVDEPKTKTPER